MQNQSVLALSLQSYSHLACLQLIATFQFLTYSRYHPPIPKPIPTDTQKPWQICLESPVARTALDCIMKTHICNPFSASIKWIRCMYICLVSFLMLFIHVVCLAVSLFLFAGYLSSWANTAKQVKRNNVFGIRRLRSKMQAASRWCRHSTRNVKKANAIG